MRSRLKQRLEQKQTGKLVVNMMKTMYELGTELLEMGDLDYKTYYPMGVKNLLEVGLKRELFDETTFDYLYEFFTRKDFRKNFEKMKNGDTLVHLKGYNMVLGYDG